ncbi:hypothetical protein KSZ_74670 [Dictyobacter formicarum]|uniref:Uncharacterized protein n=1 Tax=Dictyobacter formicarum TaxID=2778368 RepID=A0ABQ3VWN6_9CHLR|nr:hypothetical protein KSZ_74670 [Dictyobacter formicarum]
MEAATRSGRPSPNPGLSSVVELLGRHLHRAFNLTGIGKALAREGIASEEQPPALLQIQPAGAFRDKDMLDTRMVYEPSARFQAIVTAQIVSDDENIPRWIVRVDFLEELNVMLRITCRGTSGEFFAITDSQRSVDPDLVISATVLQRSLDPLAIH